METASNNPQFDFFRVDDNTQITLPMYASNASCGFTNVAEDYIQEQIDIAKHLVINPLSTFLVRARGNSMTASRIFDGSLLIVDRSLTLGRNSVCLCILNNEFTVKKVQKRGNTFYLVPSNPSYQEVMITDAMDFEVWGIITKIINEPV